MVLMSDDGGYGSKELLRESVKASKEGGYCICAEDHQMEGRRKSAQKPA